ncbi:hypothetical protein ABZ319_10645 [Nocardia sp. NPDC005978]|uniref:hypothetical protein n=1 Tax=Nocardia sp. NPDC005978 TaxID=3156725 RepID=UPI0033BCB5D0
MAEKLQGSSAAVRATSVTADSIRDELLAIAQNAKAAVSGGSSAWGDDEFGAKFAAGAKGFSMGAANMALSTITMAGSFGNLTDGLAKTADRIKALEVGNEAAFNALK